MLTTRLAPVLALATLASPTWSQCPGWNDALGLAGVEGTVYCSAVYDDGNGPALYVGGQISGPTGIPMPYLMRWDGANWDDVGGITDGAVSALLVSDDGTGPKLYAGGNFQTIGGASVAALAKWDGSSWSSVGTTPVEDVTKLMDVQTSGGWRLYVVRDLDPGPSYAGGVTVFDGVAWTTIGTLSSGGRVDAMCTFDDGNGLDIYVGGSFSSIGGVAANHFAYWDGATWTPTGFGPPGDVRALHVFDDGSGPALFLGGAFVTGGAIQATYLARWDGSAFHSIPGTSTLGIVVAVRAHDDGTGNALYVGSRRNNGETLHRWTGSAWLALGIQGVDTADRSVRTLATWDDGQGPGLFAGGHFLGAGGLSTPSVALWRNAGWETIGKEKGVRGKVLAFTRMQDAAGEALYVAGDFAKAGGVACSNIARFDGTTFTPLGNGLQHSSSSNTYEVYTLCAYDSGAGPELYAGGYFPNASNVPFTANLARWNGTSWSALGTGLTAAVSGTGSVVVRALVVHDDGSGPRLIVGGRFKRASGMVVDNVASWDGAQWSALGTGLVSPSGDGIPVTALAVYDAGNGPELYAGGQMSVPGGTWFMARWNGSSWSAVGGGLIGGYLNVEVRAMCVADLGAGSKLYVGGKFAGASGALAPHFVAWDGAWSAPIGTEGIGTRIDALAAFDEGAGAGTALYVGGALAPGFNGIARYDGAGLTNLGTGLTATFTFGPDYEEPGKALAAFDDGSGAPALYVGGGFERAGGTPAAGIARWRACDVTGSPFCSGDGTGTACPCGNFGAAGHGCATSNAPLGAQLTASGLASVASDSVVLSCTGTSDSFVTYYQGSQPVNGGAGAVFGDGLRCAGGVILRLGRVLPSGGASSFPPVGTPNVSTRGAIGAFGGRRSYQVWFRNAASFCTPSTFNLSNGWNLMWTP